MSEGHRLHNLAPHMHVPGYPPALCDPLGEESENCCFGVSMARLVTVRHRNGTAGRHRMPPDGGRAAPDVPGSARMRR